MEKIKYNEDFVINDLSKIRVRINFTVTSSFGFNEKKEATGVLTKEKSLFQFIKEVERKMTCKINIQECYIEKPLNKN